jgi:CelD/BcsL family acetyltransferase involved in cellulose biosynthesis
MRWFKTRRKSAVGILRKYVTSTLRCEVVSTADELVALRHQWSSLVGDLNSGGIFLSNEWFDAAWEWAREGAVLHVVAIWNESQLVGVAPLCRRRHVHLGLSLRTMEFAAVPDTPYCDLICAPAEAEAVAAAVYAHLHAIRDQWDMIELARLQPSSVAERLLRAVFVTSGYLSEPCVDDSDYQVDLRTTWQAYYATRSRRLKKGNNLIANHLKKDFKQIEIVVRPAVDESQVNELLDTIAELASDHWAETFHG